MDDETRRLRQIHATGLHGRPLSGCTVCAELKRETDATPVGVSVEWRGPITAMSWHVRINGATRAMFFDKADAERWAEELTPLCPSCGKALRACGTPNCTVKSPAGTLTRHVHSARHECEVTR